MNSNIQQNLEAVRSRISAAAQDCGRSPEEVTLLAVSKTKPVSDIEETIAAGQRAFGENYVQEGVSKIQYFAQTPHADELEWHFIGPLQSNKSRLVAEHFDWIHTVDRVKIAQRLSEQRPADKAALNVLIQINISDESSKSGIDLEALDALAAQVAEMPNLRLRGLMAIPAPAPDAGTRRAAFVRMRALFDALRVEHPAIDTLSMGMSDDFELAIAEGANLVRIGTALFGARPMTRTSR